MILKNLFSLCCVCIFVILAVGSSSTFALTAGSFNLKTRVEEEKDKRNYLLKDDGTRVYGKEVKWKSGFLTKDQVSIDDQKFKINEIRGYREDDVFYGRLGIKYIRRIVQGKINVYYDISEHSTTTTDHNGQTRWKTTYRTDHYIQWGEDGPLKRIDRIDDIKNLLKDCPLSIQMIDMKPSKLRKEIKKDRDYLNMVFEVYNNNCKPVE